MEAEQGVNIVHESETNPCNTYPYTIIFTYLYFSRQIGDGGAYAGVGISVYHPSRTRHTVHAIVIMSWLKEMLVMRKLLVDGVVDFKGLFGSGTP